MANQADLIRIPWRTNVPNLILVSSFARFLSKIAVICPTIGFHSVKPRKVRGRSSSPESRVVLHQAADESFFCAQWLRWAEEGFCMIEDSHSMTGFGGQVGNVAFPGKIMADSETQKLEGKDFFQRIV